MDTIPLTAARSLDHGVAGEVDQLAARAAASGGTQALSEHKRMELAAADPSTGGGGSDQPGRFAAVLGRDPRTHLLVAYGQASRAGAGDAAGYGIELLVDPDVGAPVADRLLGVTLRQAHELAVAAGHGPAPVRYWVTHATPADDRRAVAQGLVPDRDLLQMRRPLPLEDDGRDGVPTRPFRPGTDEPAWLRTNNRAFADHPEQGSWDLATLLEREQEPWFDPEGLRVYELDGRLAASCWTKVHADTDPPMGEIYVISVDPDFHGKGLGRALTRAGLDHLASVGLTVGMLYVDGGNTTAVSLYRSMGFEEHHVDRSYLGSVG